MTTRAHYGTGSMVSPPERKERIADILETIKANEYLISYYTDFINPEHPTCSFQVYLRELDKKAEAIKDERKALIATFDKASNGEIPSLRKQNDELAVKLKELKVDIRVKEVRTKKRIHKTKNLREKLAALERELQDASQMDIEELLKTL